LGSLCKRGLGETNITTGLKIKNIPIAEIQADLKSVELELNEVLKLKSKKERIEWAKKNPEKYKKIWDVHMKYEIQYAIECLEELYALVQKRLGKEKAMCEAIISRPFLAPPDC